jgi:hypothetical protein
MLRTLRAPVYVPSPHIDPITTPQHALAVFSLAIRRPLCPELLVIMLDSQFSNVLDQAVGMCSATDVATSIIAASVKPQPAHVSADNSEWQLIRETCRRAGITALDWYVITSGAVTCPSRR